MNKVVGGSWTELGQFWGVFAEGHGGQNLLMRVVARGSEFLVYADSPFPVRFSDATIPSGLAGVGVVYDGLVKHVWLGPLDQVAPNAVAANTIQHSVFANAVHLQWPAASDDANGIGVLNYEVQRNGSTIGYSQYPRFMDEAAPAGTMAYAVVVHDQHDNASAPDACSFTVAATGYDQRRVGARPTGAYWGAAGEQIDLLSGNLNFSIPLFKAQGRGGWGVTFALSYNSQIWRQDPGGVWRLGARCGIWPRVEADGWLGGPCMGQFFDCLLRVHGRLGSGVPAGPAEQRRMDFGSRDLRQFRRGRESAVLPGREFLGDGSRIFRGRG